MKPPGLVASVIGANIVFVGIGLALAVLGWLFFTTGEHFWWLFACLMAGHASYRANTKVRAYRRWEREWQGMGGEGPRPLRLPRLGGLRIFVALAAWLFAAWFAVTEGGDPNLRIPAVMFWIGSGLIPVVAATKFWARAHQKFGTVTILLRPPLNSPALTRTRREVPRHVAQFMGKSDA